MSSLSIRATRSVSTNCKPYESAYANPLFCSYPTTFKGSFDFHSVITVSKASESFPSFTNIIDSGCTVLSEIDLRDCHKN